MPLSQDETETLYYRMGYGPFRFRDLARLINVAVPKNDAEITLLRNRAIDRLLQRRRKAGEIVGRQSGQDYWWSEVAK